MDLSNIVQTIAHGDWWFSGVGRVGKGVTVASIAGWATTQNLLWLSGIVFGAATLAAQVWWDWYARKRRAWIDLEIYKARKRREADAEGLDSKTIRALQQSPDPDSDET